MRFCKLVIIGIVCNVLCSSNEPDSKRQCFSSQINFTDFDFQRVARIVYRIKDNSEFDATRYTYYTSTEEENGRRVFESVGNVFTALWKDIDNVCITQGPSDRWNSIEYLYSSENDRQGKNRIFGHLKGHFGVRDHTPLIGNADSVKGLNEGWKIFENIFCDYIAFRGATLKGILGYKDDSFMKLSQAQFDDNQSIHLLDEDKASENRLIEIKQRYSDYRNVTNADIYETFNGAINWVVDSRKRCVEMVKECKENDDIHCFKQIEIQEVTDDKQKPTGEYFFINDEMFENGKNQIDNIYCRAIGNILWYFDRLGCLGECKEGLLESHTCHVVQPFVSKWTTKDGRELLYKERGAKLSIEWFTLEELYKKAGMNLFELAQLWVKVIKAKEDHLNACYSEFVYLSIENIITGGGCYRGYVNRLMESILLAYNQ